MGISTRTYMKIANIIHALLYVANIKGIKFTFGWKSIFFVYFFASFYFQNVGELELLSPRLTDVASIEPLLSTSGIKRKWLSTSGIKRKWFIESIRRYHQKKFPDTKIETETTTTKNLKSKVETIWKMILLIASTVEE